MQSLFLRFVRTGQYFRDAQDMQSLWTGVAAVSANDAISYPQDSYKNMVEIVCLHGFSFPYLYDESQIITRAYDAVCTLDFLGSTAIWNRNTEGVLMLLSAKQGLRTYGVTCTKR